MQARKLASMGDPNDPPTGPALRPFRLVLAELVGDAEQHVNTAGMLPAGDRRAGVLCSVLRAYGVRAVSADNGAAIVVEATDETAASRLRFALVCTLAAISYRNEAEAWVCYANGDRRAPEEVAASNCKRRARVRFPGTPPWCG